MYKTVDELPVNVKSKYSPKAQAAYMAAFNSIFESTKDEARAFAGAAAAANKIDGVAPVAAAKPNPFGEKANPFGKASIMREGEERDNSFWLVSTFAESPQYDEETNTHSADVVLIRPGWSKNDYYYQESLLSTVPSLMEGHKAYIDHETKSEIKERGSRSVRDIAGWYSNVMQEPDGEVIAKLHLVKSPLTEHVVELAKSNPDLVQLSINAKGKATKGTVNGRKGMIAESFDKFYSTDLVCEAAAGGEITRMVASVPMDLELDNDGDKLDTKLDNKVEEMDIKEHESKMKEADDKLTAAKELASWLIAERSHQAEVSAWLAAENTMTESVKRTALDKVPESFKEVAKDLDVKGIAKLMESLKNVPPDKLTSPAGTPTTPKPGEEGYKRHLLI